jgi:hypothetical protein
MQSYDCLQKVAKKTKRDLWEHKPFSYLRLLLSEEIFYRR